jgi:hypothetical protein
VCSLPSRRWSSSLGVGRPQTFKTFYSTTHQDDASDALPKDCWMTWALRPKQTNLRQTSLFDDDNHNDDNSNNTTTVLTFQMTGILAVSKCCSVKVKLYLCLFLTEHHAMKAYWGVEVWHSMEVKWSATRLGRFIPREKAPSTHLIGRYLAPGAGLDAVVRRKISSPYRDSNPRSSNP